jgi:hypothetical protein
MDSTELMAQMDRIFSLAEQLHGNVCVVNPCGLLNADGNASWFALSLSSIDKPLTKKGGTFQFSSDKQFMIHITLLTIEEYRQVDEMKVAEAFAYVDLFSPSRAAERKEANVHETAMAGLLHWTTEIRNSGGHSECLEISETHGVESLESRTRLLRFLHHIRHLLGLPVQPLNRRFHLSIRRYHANGTYTIDETYCSDDDDSAQEDVRAGDNLELYLHRTLEGHLVNSGNDV